jgi:membrane protease subunit HflC
MKKAILGIVIVLLLLVVSGGFYIVNEMQQVIITQFGKPVGQPVTEAGIHFKLPFIQKATYFDKRWLEWDGYPNQIPTKDKKYIWVDTYGRWRIADPLLFFQTVRDEVGAQSRLDDILDGETRNAVASMNLIEIVRSTNRRMETTFMDSSDATNTQEMMVGRSVIQDTIRAKASRVVRAYGIELVDLRIKRVLYIDEVLKKVYDRMISERQRIAAELRSEGQGKSAQIKGEMEKELKQITSEAYKRSQEIIGEADARATDIYARAYNKDPQFYAFMKTLESYAATIDSNTTLILKTDGDFLRFLETSR